MNAITRRVRSSGSIKNVGGTTPSIIHISEDPTVDQVGLENEPKGQIAILIKDGVDAALYLKTTSLAASWVLQGGAAPVPAVPAEFQISISDIAKLNNDEISFHFPLEVGGPVFTAICGIDYVVAPAGPNQIMDTLTNLLTFLQSIPLGFSAYFSGNVQPMGGGVLVVTFDGLSAPATQASMDALYVDVTENVVNGGFSIVSPTVNTIHQIP